jgi:hypothetical protein
VANNISIKTNNKKDPLSLWYGNRIVPFRFSAGAPPAVVNIPWNDPVDGEDKDDRLFVDSNARLTEDFFPEATWNLGGAFEPIEGRQGSDGIYPVATREQFDIFASHIGPTDNLNIGNLLMSPGAYIVLDSETTAEGRYLGDHAVVTEGDLPNLNTFPNKITGAYLNTCREIINFIEMGSVEDSELLPGHLNNLSLRQRRVQQFIRHLFPLISARDLDNFWSIVDDGIEGIEDMRDLVIRYSKIISTDPATYPTRPDDEIKQGDNRASAYAAFRVVNALLKIIPQQVLWKTLNTSNIGSTHSPEYSWFTTELSSSFVRTADTYTYFDNFPPAQEIPATIDPEYNYYLRNYETAAKSSQVPEGYLPNIYVRSLYKGQLRDDLGDGDAFMYTNTYRFITELGPPPKNEEWIRACSGIQKTEFDYYDAYGKVCRQITPDVKEQIVGRTSMLYIPATQLEVSERVSETKNLPPMNIELGFMRSVWGFAGRALYNNKCSLPVLQALSMPYSNPSNFNFGEDATEEQIQQTLASLYSDNDYVIKYDYVRNGERNTGRPPQAVSLKTYKFDQVFGYGSGQTDLPPPRMNRAATVISKDTSFLYNEGEAEHTGDNLRPVNQAKSTTCLNEVNANLNSLYQIPRLGSIISPKILNSSEVLGYRIRKRNGNSQNVIQNIMMGNGAGDLATTYVDTQIKYGKDYRYDLYEYRLINSVKYRFFVICKNMPEKLVRLYLGVPTHTVGETVDALYPVNPNLPDTILPITFDIYSNSTPNPTIVEVPVIAETLKSALPEEISSQAQGLNYPLVKVLDRPPTSPTLTVFPIKNSNNKTKININLETGAYIGDNALEIINIGGLSGSLDEHYQYQKQFQKYDLPEGRLEFKNEGIGQVKNILLYRTTEMNFDVETYNDLYTSFDPSGSAVTVRKYTDSLSVSNEDEGMAYIKSYDILDNLEPNRKYYYTCVVQDIHDSPSNPSTIFQVRLVSDKGLVLPEITTVEPKKISHKSPTKNLLRYVQIDASNIQSFPYVVQDEEGIKGERSLGANLGAPVEDKDYIVRFTSKDTGRKFDLKLNFIVKVDGAPVNGT